MKLKGRRQENHVYDIIHSRSLKKKVPILMALHWYKDLKVMTPYQREYFKFKPDQKTFRYMRYFTLAGIFTGFNLFLIFNKLYEEDIYVRDPGVSVPIENPFLYSLFRIVQYRITSFLQTNFVLNLSTEQMKAEYYQFRKGLMRINQYEYYIKRKNTNFDFIYLGEIEQLPMD